MHISLLTPPQCAAVARFIRFKIAVDAWLADQMHAELGDGPWSDAMSEWQVAYDSHWKRIDETQV